MSNLAIGIFYFSIRWVLGSYSITKGVILVSQKVRVLSIDGGGIRGIIPTKILMRVEELLQAYSKNPHAKIGDYFDLIAGTSTGGIITALSLCPEQVGSQKTKYAATDFLNFYLDYAQQIFSRSFMTRYLDRLGLFNPLYRKEPLEELVEKYLGDYRLSDLTKPCLIPAYDTQSGEAVFFNQLGIVKGSPKDLLVRDIIRATTAAPTYFPVARPNLKNTFIDGGLFANNPALNAYVEATKFPCEPRQREILILSLGTGAKDIHYPYEQVKSWGRLGWVVPVINIYGSAASQTVNHQLTRLYGQKDLAANYLRIEPSLDKFEVDKGMDSVSEQNLQALQKIGEATASEYDEQLKLFVKKVYESHLRCPHENLFRQPRSSKT